MVTDCQVRKLMKLLNEEQTLSLASAKSGMDEKTARKYRCLGEVDPILWTKMGGS